MSDPKRAVFNRICYNKAMAVKTYIDETKGELKHVSWPTRTQAINYTILVVAISLVTAAYLSLFDGLFAYILKALLSKYLY